MTSEFLGRGWNFPPKLDENCQVAMVEHEESIRQAVWIILSTAPGERVMRPDFGCGIHDLVFAPNSPGTAGRVAGEVRQALVRWEPRIDLLDVQATAQPGEPNTLLIRIEYRVRTTNSRFNLVYPFYLE
jgi:phage baseplate assembly protein W